jgi:hypothetical protein
VTLSYRLEKSDRTSYGTYSLLLPERWGVAGDGWNLELGAGLFLFGPFNRVVLSVDIVVGIPVHIQTVSIVC